ncbi:hypothetical protein CVU75_03615, partial [Candidatus Dependentiae bacterium HGW-Dependentiae-1]
MRVLFNFFLLLSITNAAFSMHHNKPAQQPQQLHSLAVRTNKPQEAATLGDLSDRTSDKNSDSDEERSSQSPTEQDSPPPPLPEDQEEPGLQRLSAALATAIATTNKL